jgi:hypothetical protein
MAPAEYRRTFISVDEEDDRATEKSRVERDFRFSDDGSGVRRRHEPG